MAVQWHDGVTEEQPTLVRTLSWPSREDLTLTASPVLRLWAVIKMSRRERLTMHTAKHRSAHLQA